MMELGEQEHNQSKANRPLLSHRPGRRTWPTPPAEDAPRATRIVRIRVKKGSMTEEFRRKVQVTLDVFKPQPECCEAGRCEGCACPTATPPRGGAWVPGGGKTPWVK
jgi:hypothetical protein